MKKLSSRLLKSVLTALLVTLCGATAWADSSAPQVTYALHCDGSYLNPKESTARFDFDREFKSLTWAYYQGGNMIASGTTAPLSYTPGTVKIPVSAQIGSTATVGQPITLKITGFTLNDDSTVSSDLEYTYQLTDKVTIYQFYFDQPYLGSEPYELKATTYYIYGVKGSKILSATTEVYQNGNLLGTFQYLPSTAGKPTDTAVIKAADVNNIITNLGIEAGLVTFRVIDLEYQDASGASQHTVGNLGEVTYQVKGASGKVTSSSGPSSFMSWFDPAGDNGIITLRFDKKVADGAVASLEIPGELFALRDISLPITVAADRMSLTVDLRGIILSPRAMGESSAPENIIVNITNLKCLDGASMTYTVAITGSSNHTYQNKWSHTYSYTENGASLGYNNLAAGASGLVYLSNAAVTYVDNQNRAYVQNSTGSGIINDPQHRFSVGSLDGEAGLRHLGGSVYEVVGNAYSCTHTMGTNINPAEIASGTRNGNVGRLVKFTADNVSSMAYDENSGAYLIDGVLPIVDVFGVLPFGFSWDNIEVSEAIGLLTYNGSQLVLAPRTADELTYTEVVPQEPSISLAELKQTATGETSNVRFENVVVNFAHGEMFAYFLEADGVAIAMGETGANMVFNRGDVLNGTVKLMNYGGGIYVATEGYDNLTVTAQGQPTVAATNVAPAAAGLTPNHFRLVKFVNSEECPITYNGQGNITVAGTIGVPLDQFEDVLDYSIIGTVNSVTGIIYPTNISAGLEDEESAPIMFMLRDLDDLDYTEAALTLSEAKATAPGTVSNVRFDNVVVNMASDSFGGYFLEADGTAIALGEESTTLLFNRGDVLNGTVKLMNVGGGIFVATDAYAKLNVTAQGQATEGATDVTPAAAGLPANHFRLVKFVNSEECPITFNGDGNITIAGTIGAPLELFEDQIDFATIGTINSVTGIIYPMTISSGLEPDEATSVMFMLRDLEDMDYEIYIDPSIPLSFAQAKTLEAGAAANVNFNNAHVTYSSDQGMYVEADGVAIMLMAADEGFEPLDPQPFQRGDVLNGTIMLGHMGGGLFANMEDISALTVSEHNVELTPAALTLDQIGAASNACRLVTVVNSDQTPLVLNPKTGSVSIADRYTWSDIAYTIGDAIDYEKIETVNSVTGLIYRMETSMGLEGTAAQIIIMPRDANDIAYTNAIVSLTLAEAKATEIGDVNYVKFENANVTWATNGALYVESNGTAIQLKGWDPVAEDILEELPFTRGDVLNGIIRLQNYGDGMFANVDELTTLTATSHNVERVPATMSIADATTAAAQHRLVKFTNSEETPLVLDPETGVVTIGDDLLRFDMTYSLDDIDFEKVDIVKSVTGIVTAVDMGNGVQYYIVPRDKRDISYTESMIVDPNAPAIVYCPVRVNGPLSAKRYDLRLDWDRDIESVDWQYLQDGEIIANGTSEVYRTYGSRTTNIPVNSGDVLLNYKVNNGLASYGDIVLKITRIVGADGTVYTSPVYHPMTLAELAVTSIYPDQSGPGEEPQEIKVNTNFLVSATMNKMVSGEIEVYSNGEMLGTYPLVAYSNSNLTSNLKIANCGDFIEHFDLQPGFITIRVTKLTYQDEEGNPVTETNEAYAEVTYRINGKPGTVLGYSGLSGGVCSWFDPSDNNGILTLRVDKPLADGAIADFEYGNERQNFVVSLPVTIADDRMSLQVDLRSKLLTIDAITGEHDYIFYDEQGNEVDPPTVLVMTVSGMKTTEGADIMVTMTNEDRTVTLTGKWSKSFAYGEIDGSLALAKSCQAGKTQIVNVDNYSVTYVNGNDVYIENLGRNEAARIVNAPDALRHVGTLNGNIVFTPQGQDLKVYQDAYDVNVSYSSIGGVLVPSGAYANNVNANRLVTLNNTNTTSIAYNPSAGKLMIDGTLPVEDRFNVLGSGYNWDSKVTSVTGILYVENGNIVCVAPRSTSDIIRVELTTIGDAAAMSYGTANIMVDNAKITYVADGKAFIEDETGAAALEVGSFFMQEGQLSGYMSVTIAGQGVFELDNSQNYAVRPGAVSGTLIDKGAYAQNLNRLVILNNTNTDSFSYEEGDDYVSVDGNLMVMDVFGVLDEDIEWANLAGATGILMQLQGAYVLAPRRMADLSFEQVLTLHELKETTVGSTNTVTLIDAKVIFVTDMMGGAMFIEDKNAGIMVYLDDKEAPFQRGDVLNGNLKLYNYDGALFLANTGYDDVVLGTPRDHQPTAVLPADFGNAAFHHRLVTVEHTAEVPIVVDKAAGTITIAGDYEVDLRYIEDEFDIYDVVRVKRVTGILIPVSGALTADDDDEPEDTSFAGARIAPRTMDDIEYFDVTSIDTLDADAANGALVIYNLAGIRIHAESVTDLAPGLYIVNGVKVLVK